MPGRSCDLPFFIMSDIIQLLPDSVANQISAGEVVQRPASAVKELLENTIDAGATEIKLIIKESGKMLIQVVDNGCGMSERDARMCFERHATSKIRTADDLFAIRTLGFRGEALASIASVAQVELRSKRTGDEIGTLIGVEGSEFKGQSAVSCPSGTSISVKNLFFNVPARRNFLKSNTLELKYIIEEFFRVALVNPDISFGFYNQDKVMFQLPVGNLKQRIINLYGSTYGQRLIPVEQQTDLVNIAGFIGKPEFAKKTRGEQYFFTNGRFMKSPYLHHAVETAFRELIPSDSFPSYFLYFEVDPKTIDVNIHPTKTEINFQDIKSIYAILRAAVKQSIGRFSIAPTLDFNPEQSLDLPPLPRDYNVKPPSITINPDYNPFEKKIAPQTQIPLSDRSKGSIDGWQKLYEPIPLPAPEPELMEIAREEQKKSFQLHNSFIVTYTKTGIVIIDQQHAHERIIYERMLEQPSGTQSASQKQLIPHTIQLTPDDAQLLREWLTHLTAIGFDIAEFGNNCFVVHALPASVKTSNLDELFESLVESLKTPDRENKSNPNLVLAKSLAKKLAVRRGKKLLQVEIESIVENLFSCKVPEVSPDGKPTLTLISLDELNRKFKLL
jgi:DNA mismatch repair protein MutL